VARGVLAGARNERRCRMRRVNAKTGQNTGLPDRPSPITSPRTPFFWVVNVSATKVTRDRSSSGMVVARNRCWPIQHWTSVSVKGVVSDDVPVYSPGRSRKKNARQIMSAMAWVSRVADGCAAKAATWRKI
jgi:hypothetical protein